MYTLKNRNTEQECKFDDANAARDFMNQVSDPDNWGLVQPAAELAASADHLASEPEPEPAPAPAAGDVGTASDQPG